MDYQLNTNTNTNKNIHKIVKKNNNTEYIETLFNKLNIDNPINFINSNFNIFIESLSELSSQQYNDISKELKNKLHKLQFTKSNFENFYYEYILKTDDYIIANQYNLEKNTSDCHQILIFNNLLVLNWNLNNNYTTKYDLLEYIENLLSQYPYTFLLYETVNGYHAYCVSQEFIHWKYDTLKLMNQLQLEPYYICFSQYTGFVVKLQLEHSVKQINNYPILPNLIALINVKDTLMK
jgi:hypothetical protein